MKLGSSNIVSYQQAVSMLQNGSLDIAIKKLQVLSQAGDGHADGVLGVLYEFGIGHIHADVSKALSLYERSVKNSDSLQSWMGIARITLQGPAELRDYARAFDCFTYVAENSDYPQAWLALGEMHLHGLGRETDLGAATECYQKAVDLGNVLGYPGLASVAFKKRRVLESLKYRVIGALKGFKEPDGSDALKPW